MNPDLAAYWSQLRYTRIGWVHPEDEDLLLYERHSFNLEYPPPAFVGDIENAKILILTANGGYSEVVTPKEFATDGAALAYVERLKRPAAADWNEVSPYYRGINYSGLIFSGRAAIVNACAYRSSQISQEPENRKLIRKLPSVRLARRWLAEVVFPQMKAGGKVVVGKRHGLWDLPNTIKENNRFILDPAPVSPHLSSVVLQQLQSL